jgi:acyl-CoA synthetase (AMP-forming)/AMP-acid ligase II
VNPNIAARMAERAARHPERQAIVEHSGGRVRRITFGELASRVAGLSAGLGERGVAPGDRVLLFVPMSIDLYLTLLACCHLGAVSVFVDAWADRARLERAVEAARPRALVGTPRAHLLRLVSRAVRAIPIPIVVGSRWRRLARLERPRTDARSSAATAQAAAAPAPVGLDTPALVTFTTGSTGRIKAAARSHGFLWAQHEVLAAHLGLTEADVDLPTLPVFVLNNLATGTSSVLPDLDPRRPAEIDPETIHCQIVAEHVTSASGSPAFFERLLGWCVERGSPLPVRALFTGGAPVLPHVARLLADPRAVRGTAHVVYGSTEAEPIASIEAREMLRAMGEASQDRGEALAVAGPAASARQPARRRHETDSAAAPDPRTGGAEPDPGICAGFPVPQIALRLIRPCNGPVVLGAQGWREWEVSTGEVGEIVVSGAHVLTGYWNDPAAERENKIRDGVQTWHRTGDAGRLDRAGRLWLMGRLRQRVERAGSVWWSAPAELIALRLAGVRHAAYFGLPDHELGQRAVLCVEVAGGRLEPGDRDRLSRWLSPIPVDELRALERIPRDPRHQSKTDLEALLAIIQAPGARAGG